MYGRPGCEGNFTGRGCLNQRFSPPPTLWRLVTDMVLTAVVTLVVASPFLFYVVRGMAEVPTQINSPTGYSADLLNYLLPTPVSLFGGSLFAGTSRHFIGNPSEQGAYLGLPLQWVTSASSHQAIRAHCLGGYSCPLGLLVRPATSR
jgi:hypothetical protein